MGRVWALAPRWAEAGRLGRRAGLVVVLLRNYLINVRIITDSEGRALSLSFLRGCWLGWIGVVVGFGGLRWPRQREGAG